jgi:hypothetical protein
VPKSKLPALAGDQLIDGGPPPLPIAADTSNADTAVAAMMIRTSTRITYPLCRTAAITAAETPMILTLSGAVKPVRAPTMRPDQVDRSLRRSFAGP